MLNHFVAVALEFAHRTLLLGVNVLHVLAEAGLLLKFLGTIGAHIQSTRRVFVPVNIPIGLP